MRMRSIDQVSRHSAWIVGCAVAAITSWVTPAVAADKMNVAGGDKVAMRQQHIADLEQRARDYAQRNGLPVCEVPTNNPARKLTRLCVPILPETAKEFQTLFQSSKGAAIARLESVDKNEYRARVYFSPKRLMARDYKPFSVPTDQFFIAENTDNRRARCVVLPLPDEHHRSLKAFWKKYIHEGEEPFYFYTHADEYLAAHADQDQLYSQCMAWLTQARVTDHGAKKTPWAHVLGVTRSQDPPNWLAKLIYAGWIGPIGIPVRSIEEFQALAQNPLEMLGPPPEGGAVDATKE